MQRLFCGVLCLALAAVALQRDVRGGEEPARLKISGRDILAPDGMPIRLRGFNIQWWGSPTAKDVADIKALGGNSVRYMFGYKAKGKFDPSQLKRLDEHIQLFTSQKLWVIPNLFRLERKDAENEKAKGPYTDPALQREFLELWTYIITRFKDEPYIGAWEPINEPHDVSKEALRSWYQEVIKHMRALDARTPIVVEGTNFSYPKDLGEHLKFDDPAIIYSFHMYVPFDYTHQKLEKPLSYPGEKWSRAFLAKEMEPAFAFRDAYHVPVYCGEFGVRTRAAGYEQWLRDTASVLEECGAHWSHWSWMHVPKAPINDSFDCNTQKTGIYEAMKTIFEKTRRQGASLTTETRLVPP